MSSKARARMNEIRDRLREDHERWRKEHLDRAIEVQQVRIDRLRAELIDAEHNMFRLRAWAAKILENKC